MSSNKYVVSELKKASADKAFLRNHEKLFSPIKRTSNEDTFQKALLLGFLMIFATLGKTTSSTRRGFPNDFKHLPNETVTEFDPYFEGCDDQSCKITCTEAASLSKRSGGPCERITTTSCNSSRFSLDNSGNKWFDVDHTRNEVIYSRRLTSIPNIAFNSSLFVDTIFLNWYQFEAVESKMFETDRVFLLGYPVRVILTHLCFNTRLYLPSNGRVFVNAILQNFIYLDLSNSSLCGPLKRKICTTVRHFKYLIITNSKKSKVKENAFGDLAINLELLNLSRSHLIIVDASSIITLQKDEKPAFVLIELKLSKPLCDYRIQQMVRVFLEYNPRLAENFNCYASSYLSDTSPNQLDLTGISCNSSVKEVNSITSVSSVNTYDSINNNNDTSPGLFNGSTENDLDDEASLPLTAITFPRPSNKLQINLFSNRSAQLIISDFRSSSAVNIIWFTDPVKPKSRNSDLFNSSTKVDYVYNCTSYSEPFVIEDLMPNTTYTFCLLPVHQISITPYNCLPLYVPPSYDHVWIFEDEKRFMIGILCLIFTMSTVLGILIGYFGLKRHPYLLDDGEKEFIVPVTKDDLRNAELAMIPKDESIQERICATETSIFISKLLKEYEVPKLYEIYHDCAIKCMKNSCASLLRRPSSLAPLPEGN